jgi:hypothetical protein
LTPTEQLRSQWRNPRIFDALERVLRKVELVHIAFPMKLFAKKASVMKRRTAISEENHSVTQSGHT